MSGRGLNSWDGRCAICDRRLRPDQLDTHEGWHADVDDGRLPADTPDPIPSRSWVAPWARHDANTLTDQPTRNTDR